MPLPWEYWTCIARDHRKEGRAIIALAAPAETPGKVVRFSAAQSDREVRWVAAARREWPEVPASSTLAGSNYVLLEHEIFSHSPVPCAKGVFLFVVWGVYYYGLIRPKPVDSPIEIPDMPPSIGKLGAATKFLPQTKIKRFLDFGTVLVATTGGN